MPLIDAALRERSEPRSRIAGSPLSTAEVQHRMMTFVNVTISEWQCGWHPERLTLVGGQVFTRGIEHTFENRMILVMQEVLL
jgi:hypothetical protein